MSTKVNSGWFRRHGLETVPRIALADEQTNGKAEEIEVDEADKEPFETHQGAEEIRHAPPAHQRAELDAKLVRHERL